MPFVSPGKWRESTNWSAELYKDAVRNYIETKGYAQVRSSFREGTLADMIFVPTTLSKSKADIWVECKYSEISIEDGELRREIIEYLEAWLKLPVENRPTFYIFVKRAKAPKKWGKIFDLNDLEFLRSWLSEIATNSGNNYILNSLSERFNEIGEFFVKSWAYSWDLPELQSAVEESEDESILSFKRSAEKELEEMNKRISVGNQRDKLFGNMIGIVPPRSYVKIGYDSILDDYLEHNKHDFPPFAKLSVQELITLNDEEVLERFKMLNGEREILSIEELETSNQNSLFYLLNQVVCSIFEHVGAEPTSDSNTYYFPLKDTMTPLKIGGAKNKPVMVAKPLLKKENNEDEWPLELGYMVPEQSEINFGFHKGFRVRTIHEWDRYLVSLNLKKLYSKDGKKLMDGEKARKIDKYFRNSKYAHGDSFKTVISALFHQLKTISKKVNGVPSYFHLIEFGDIIELASSSSPVTIDMTQNTLELEFEEETEFGDES